MKWARRAARSSSGPWRARAREQGFVGGSKIRFDVLEVVEQLQEDPVPERE